MSDKHKPEGGNPGIDLCCPRCVKKMTPMLCVIITPRGRRGFSQVVEACLPGADREIQTCRMCFFAGQFLLGFTRRVYHIRNKMRGDDKHTPAGGKSSAVQVLYAECFVGLLTFCRHHLYENEALPTKHSNFRPETLRRKNSYVVLVRKKAVCLTGVARVCTRQHPPHHT